MDTENLFNVEGTHQSMPRPLFVCRGDIHACNDLCLCCILGEKKGAEGRGAALHVLIVVREGKSMGVFYGVKSYPLRAGLPVAFHCKKQQLSSSTV